MTAFPKPQREQRARKPLRRGKRLNRRGKTKHARRERDFEYMAWVSTRPCLARFQDATGSRCSGRIHVHHAFGRRVADSDKKTIPLCDACHRAWHNHSGVFEGWDRERRHQWSLWAVEFTQIERRGGVL